MTTTPHLSFTGTRARPSGRAHTLGEQPPIGLTCPLTPEQIRGVIAWMDVANAARWQPTGGKTYCNVYASDLVHVLGGYLPRVWWYRPHDATADTPIVYAETVREMNANSLCGWMREFGASYGWHLSDRPQIVGTGEIGVVIGKARKGHGHVQVLYSDEAGIVHATQAGITNFEKKQPYSEAFWRGSRYTDAVWAVLRPEELGSA